MALMASQQIGTWSKSRGSISVVIPGIREGLRGYAAAYRSKYLGEPDNPFPPAIVETDLNKEFPGLNAKLIPTSSRGGIIIKAEAGDL